MNNHSINTKLITALAIGITAVLALTISTLPNSQQSAEARSAPQGHPDCQHLPGGCSNAYIMGDAQYTQLRSGHDSFSRAITGHGSNCHHC